ncbi:MAG: ribose 5-phosphate isomerase B [Chloroflexi bacterium]|nr:ribose 5-phosphate isomerase B [Chloroflexota bacterium]
MKLAIGGDHAGFPLKQHLIPLLKQWGHEVNDLGAHNTEPSDYPDFAKAVGMAVQKGEAERGIIVCGSGIGACVVANKLKGIRAALVSDTYSARQGVDHDDVNVLCLGGRVVGTALAEEIVKAFLAARFTAEERHLRRLGKVRALEEGK